MLHAVGLDLDPNEASDLAEVGDPELLAARGWDAALLTVLDEGTAEDSIALLAHDEGAALTEGWSSHRLRFDAGDEAGRTEDAEALAVRGGEVFVVGSHYGSKTGPLKPKRHWLATFATADLGAALDGGRPPLRIARTRFRVHRAVNDALKAARVEPFALSGDARQALVGATIERGTSKGKGWARLVEPGDVPINVEGAAFATDGRLLLALRFPTTREGRPLIVALEDPDAIMDDPRAVPAVGDVWVVDAGTAELPLGLRALDRTADGGMQAIVGSLDARGKDSALLDGHPEAGEAGCAHVRLGPLPPGGGVVPAEVVHDFGELRSVEGVADGPHGHAMYVVDEESHVDMRFLLVD